MSRRKQILVTGEIYHVFNRSNGKENILINNDQLSRFFETVNYYRFNHTLRFSAFKNLDEGKKHEYLNRIYLVAPRIEIYSFSFMPTHFHFLIKQMQENAVRTFTSQVQNSFAKWFNLKEDRHGGVFQNSFKAIRIESEEELIHVSRYIHLNPVTSYQITIEELFTYQWTSFSSYLNSQKSVFTETSRLFRHFKTKERLVSFVKDQVDYQRKLDLIKNRI